MIKKETFTLMESIQQFFPHFEITQTKIDTWQKVLSEIDYEQAEANLIRYAKGNSYPPAVADIVKGKKDEDFARRSIPSADETKAYLQQMIENENLSVEQIENIEESKRAIRKLLGVE